MHKYKEISLAPNSALPGRDRDGKRRRKEATRGGWVASFAAGSIYVYCVLQNSTFIPSNIPQVLLVVTVATHSDFARKSAVLLAAT